MRELRDVLHEAFDGHARALDRSGVEVEPSSAFGDIRRRRRRRAAASAAGAFAACSALAVAAVAVPGLRDQGSSSNTSSLPASDAPAAAEATVTLPSPAAGSPQWCHLDTFPATNPEAWGPAGYAGRLYTSGDTDEVVWVNPDGTHGDASDAGIPAGAVDSAARSSGMALAIDYNTNGSAGGVAYLTDPEGPRLGYEWTTVAPEPAPVWVDPQLLMEVHTLTLGFGGTGLEPPVAGADAVVETVARYADGTEQAVRIGRGEPGAIIGEYDGLVSASIRATNPDGEVYEITSHYDATQTYEAACGLSVPILAEDGGDDVPEAEDFVAGEYLEGPESAVFQCSAAVPAEFISEPSRHERHAGRYYDVEEAGIEFDFGEGGFVLGAPEKYFEGVEWQGRMDSGWTSTSFERSGQVEGNVIYEALIWVDDQDRIVARQQHYTEEDQGLVMGHGQDDLYPIPGSQNGDRLWYIGDTSELALPCAGVDPAQVDDAELALIYGYGPSVDDMAWHVYFPERG